MQSEPRVCGQRRLQIIRWKLTVEEIITKKANIAGGWAGQLETHEIRQRVCSYHQ